MRNFKGNGLLILAMAWMGTAKQQELLIAEHGFKLDQFNNDGSITIPSENGEITCKLNDYLMKVNGAYTAASPENFEETYKELEEGSEESAKCDGLPVSAEKTEEPAIKEEVATSENAGEASRPVTQAEIIAEVCHEANKKWCEQNGDHSQKNWKEAEQWQRDSAVKGVQFRMDNPDAGHDAQHNSWMKEKTDGGWVFGEVKDAEAKTHPCIVPFDQLPKFQQQKDALFCAIVDALK